MSRDRAWGHVGRVAISVAVYCLALAAAYYLSALVYERTGVRPAPLIGLLVNAFLAVILVVVAMNLFGLIFRPRPRNFFAPITDALERIGAGDFTIRIDEHQAARGPFGDLVRSVNQTAARLDQLEKMRREFVSDVSHEIQSPLTSIRGFAAALRQEDVTERDRLHYLEIIEAESLRLSRLSANLLRLASLESGQVELAPKTYRLDRQIRELILASETQWSGKGLDLDVELAEAEVAADEDLLSQVWVNLIHNAIKFTPEGGSIRVALRRQADRLEMSIADSGAGISAEDQARIFERFYKADRSRQSSGGGSGLGLAIAKKIVEMHGGAISVHSRVGGGAEFLVRLPAV